MESPDGPDNLFKILFDQDCRLQLRTIARWAKICAICAFSSYAIGLIVAILSKDKAIHTDGQGQSMSYSLRSLSIAVAFVSALVGYGINYFLFRFSLESKRALEQKNQIQLTEGLRNLKTYFKILGMLFSFILMMGGVAFLFGIMRSSPNAF